MIHGQDARATLLGEGFYKRLCNRRGRMIRNKIVFLLFFASLLATGCRRAPEPAGEPVTFLSMLAPLTDRAALAMPPRPGVMRMVSSYDRTGGNNDWFQDLVPDESGLVTLAELTGPGCVVRFWMTGDRYRDLRFYIDGEKAPRLMRPKNDFFGGELPFAYPLSGQVSGGRYSYVPIPYEKSLVMKAYWPDMRPENRPYLHVNYFTFPRGTPVESFPRELSEEQLAAAEAVAQAWQEPDMTLERTLLAALDKAGAVEIAPGATHVWLDEAGEGMVEGFAIGLDFDEEAHALKRQLALRDLALHIHWDGEPAPSVAVPLGDFFGNALAWRSWRSMFAGQTNGVFVSQWPMPFRQGARATLRNDGTEPVRARFARVITQRPASSRYFHAAWHHAVGQGIPFPILHTEGSGHYVGCYLVSLGWDGSWNILEGDESFQIDDEPWPSIHGTGLEDYFNGAWYYFGIFDLPIHGLLEKAAMRTTQYRWHPSDPVPFSERLSMQIEFGHGNTAQGYMASVAYWYQDRPQPQRPLAEEPRRKPPDPLEGAVIMAELFELERVGLWREAAERCESYVRRIDHPDAKALLRMRKAGYRQLLGDDLPEGLFSRLAADAQDESVRKQAAMLDRFCAESNRALLGVQCRGTFRAYLNGELAGEGSSPNHMDVWLVDLPDGEHELAVEVTPVSREAFLSACLRRGNEFLRTDGEWEMARQRPAAWPRTDDPDIEWEPAPRMAAAGMLPRMDAWQLPLNVWVNMQSGAQLYRGWDGWDHAPGNTAYFRRRFAKPVR